MLKFLKKRCSGSESGIGENKTGDKTLDIKEKYYPIESNRLTLLK
jgi:hypothetical protein